MKQFNPHVLRSYIDRIKGLKPGKHLMDHNELTAVALDLADLLLYSKELENSIKELNKQLEEASALTIEMLGDKF